MTFKLRKCLPVCIGAVVLMLAGTGAAAAGYILGDADSDGEVTIIDATCIQRELAGLPVSGGFYELAADVDGSGGIEITDATYIQRWLADLETPYQIGVQFEAPSESTEPAVDPTIQPTEQPTEPPTEPPTQMPTDEEGWGREIFKP